MSRLDLFGTLRLELQAVLFEHPEDSSLFREEDALRATEPIYPLDENHPETRWASLERGLQHVVVRLTTENGQSFYLGHNIKSFKRTFSAVQQCYNLPRLRVDLLHGGSRETPEQVKKEMIRRMGQITGFAKYVADSLLCRRKIDGFNIGWHTFTDTVRHFYIIDRTNYTSVAIFLKNLDEDPDPEIMEIDYCNETMVHLSAPPGKIRLPWAEDFAYLFTNTIKCEAKSNPIS